MENLKIRRGDIISKLFAMILMGIASFLLSFFIMIIIFGFHSLDQAVSFILKLLTDNDTEFKSNSIIFILLVVFLFGYLLFTFFMIGIENFFWMKKEMYSLNRLRYQKKFYGIFTFGVVLFGFIPVIIASFNEVEAVKNNAILYFITMSLFFLYPYLYFARTEGNMENESNTEQQIGQGIWKFIWSSVSFFLMKIHRANKLKNSYALLLFGSSLIVLALFLAFVFYTGSKLSVYI